MADHSTASGTGSLYASCHTSHQLCPTCLDLDAANFTTRDAARIQSFDYGDLVRTTADGCQACAILQLGILNARKHSLPLGRVELEASGNRPLNVYVNYPGEPMATYLEFYTPPGKIPSEFTDLPFIRSEYNIGATIELPSYLLRAILWLLFMF
jgi:hypothetical protein